MDIGGQHSDALWLRLQAMPLPRSNQVAADLARIAATVQEDLGMVAEMDLEQLGDMLRDG